MNITVNSTATHSVDFESYDFQVGDSFEIRLENSIKHKVLCVDKNDAYTTFLFEKVAVNMCLNLSHPRCQDYVGSDLSKYMKSGFISLLPNWLREKVVGEVTIPSFENILGTCPDWAAPINDETQWELLKDPSKRIAFSNTGNELPQAYWIRNIVTGVEEDKGSVIDYVGSSGFRCNAYHHIGVRPCFKIQGDYHGRTTKHIE